MPRSDRLIGISALAPFLPRLRIDLRAWCRWTGRDEERVLRGTGSGFRMPGPREDAITMAAAAVMRLVRSGKADPQRIGFLALATESARDDAVGTVIVKGLVDLALQAEGREMLARDCEVPEFKQACLAGVYATKAAARWLAWDGSGRQAIVVASDVAAYPRGGTGEPTQGAGAVAVLLEEDPLLLQMDLLASAGTSMFREADFRKPVLRHILARGGSRPAVANEFPSYDGPWSTICYLDETLRAIEALARRRQTDVAGLLDSVTAAFFHRPYRKMPIQALALLRLRALAGEGERAEELEQLCREGGIVADRVRAELAAGPETGKAGEEAWPAVDAAWRLLRGRETFRREADALLGLGDVRMSECGNLYAGSILAWMAAGLEEAATIGRDLAGARVLAVGYGSGNAAEAALLQVAPGWRGAARRIGFGPALDGAIDLSQEEYDSLHDGRPVGEVLDLSSDGFLLDRVGWRSGPRSDAGAEYYAFDPSWRS